MPVGNTISQGFILSGSTFTSIAFPKSGPKGTAVTGINKWNTIVGYFSDSNGFNHGFKRYSNGSWVKLDYPGAQFTRPASINDNGTIVGTFDDSTGFHGFIYQGGQWSQLEHPNEGVGATNLLGISNASVIIGYVPWTPTISFLYQNGAFQPFEDLAADTGVAIPYGIAANGLITGNESINSAWNGFIATCK
jgi:hypothetical protein